MKVNLKTTNDENATATSTCHQRGQRTVNGIIGNTRRGIVVDQTLDPDSNNPVANKPVSTALAALAGRSENIAPTLNLLDLDSGELRTSITEEEKDNLEKGLYNQVMYPDGDGLNLLMPSKVLGDKSLDVISFVQFYFDTNTESITSLDIYGFNIGTKDPITGNYHITVEKQITIPIGTGGASVQSVDAYGEGGATTIEKGKIATDLTGVELKIPFVLNIYEDNTLSGTPTRIIMTNKFGENNYLGTLDFLNHYLVNVVKGTDGKYSYSSNIIPNPTKNTLFNKSILVPQDLEDPIPILPCTTADNGKVLSVVEGQAQWATPTGGGVNGLESDEEGNLTASKNLEVGGKLALKSLVSDTNPDGDITKELGGGGGGKIY